MTQHLVNSQLSSFLAVVACGGVSAAARSLAYSQSNVSIQIQGLERALGAKLFHRRHQRLDLTPAGERLAALAPVLLDLAASIETAVRNEIHHPAVAADDSEHGPGGSSTARAIRG